MYSLNKKKVIILKLSNTQNISYHNVTSSASKILQILADLANSTIQVLSS